MQHSSTNPARNRHSRSVGLHWPGVAGLAALTLATSVPAVESPPKPSAAPSIKDFADLGLDQLLNMSLTSVGKKEQKLSAAPAAKRITVRASHENDRVRISVTDTGVGIPVENLNRIFNHGFTTMKTGHGFGLHSAAKEMGGNLAVQSDGPGHGARFTLELPLQSAGRATTPAAEAGRLSA